MKIKHNLNALNANRHLSANNTKVAKNLEKLSSGLRINRSADDAAGLAISEKMRGQIRGLDMASKNAQDAISLVQTAEGALQETHAILQRMRELSVQSANGTYQDGIDRVNLNKELDALKLEIDRIATSTNFNNQNLLDGSIDGRNICEIDVLGKTFKANFGSIENGKLQVVLKTPTIANQIPDVKFEISDSIITIEIIGCKYDVSEQAWNMNLNAIFKGRLNNDKDLAEKFKGIELELPTVHVANLSEQTNIANAKAQNAIFQIGASGESYQQVSLKVNSQTTSALKIDGIAINPQSKAKEAIEFIDSAINSVSETRADLGAVQNRLEHTVNNLGVTAENLTAAESRFRDVDMAKEMMEMTKNNVLTQAAQAMLAQANQQPQGVLQLLR